jgi:DNA replication protein DnaC
MTHYLKDATLPDCPLCRNTRIKTALGVAYQCPCTKRGTPLLRFLDTTIGRMYHSANLDTLTGMDDEQNALLKHAERFVKWWEPHKKGLYLWSSNTGNGKSLIASAMMNKIDLPSQAIEASVLWDAMRSCYDSNEPQQRYMNVASYVPALLLDDLGMGSTEKSDEWLTDILNARIEKGLLTIITSNIHPSKIKAVSDRCVSRLLAHTHPLQVKNTRDWRVALKPYMEQTHQEGI